MIEEQSGDRLLKIRTSGRDATGSDQYKYPYEPTPYSVLERLGNSGEIRKQNTLLDYGCGKGRVDFFLSYQTGCRSIGIEYNERFYQAALKNKEASAVGRKTDFVLEDASRWAVPREVDRCFFFNPFCLEILKKVMARSWNPIMMSKGDSLVLLLCVRGIYKIFVRNRSFGEKRKHFVSGSVSRR